VPCAAIRAGSRTVGIRRHRAALSARIEDDLRNRSLTQRPGAVSAIHSGLLMTTRSREAAAGRRTATGGSARAYSLSPGTWKLTKADGVGGHAPGPFEIMMVRGRTH
jgi:hypothetical protein